MSSDQVITIKSVTKRYGDVLAVDDVSISVQRGDVLVLLGSSGCGKTTTLRLIAGLEQPDGGSIWLDGRCVAGKNTWVPPEARKIGMVFQDYALFPHLTSKENIAFPLNGASRKAQNERVRAMLALVGMEGMDDRYPHQLSGGQQQRIALARALAPRPSVVLLDEPFSNLDAFRRKQVREEVRQILKQASATGIFVTHDQEEAMRIADVVAVMQGGRVLQVGEPAKLYRHPEHPAVANFLGEVNRLPGTADGETMQTALGELRLFRKAGGRVEALIRPEAIVLDRDAIANATVRSVRFYGYYQMVTLELADEITLEARVWAQVQLAPGDTVHASVQGNVVTFTVGELAI